MSTKLTKDVYEHLIKEDLEWLMKQPDTLERHHIEMILIESVNFYYPEKTSPPMPIITQKSSWSEPLRSKWRDCDNSYDHIDYHDRDR